MRDLQSRVDQFYFLVGDAHNLEARAHRIAPLHIQEVFAALVLQYRGIIETRLADESHVTVIRHRWRRYVNR